MLLWIHTMLGFLGPLWSWPGSGSGLHGGLTALAGLELYRCPGNLTCCWLRLSAVVPGPRWTWFRCVVHAKRGPPWSPVPSSLCRGEAGGGEQENTCFEFRASLERRPAGAEEHRPGRAQERCHAALVVGESV